MATDTAPEMTYTGRELRWLSDAYEQAQRIRIEVGERIRAVIQGRDETWVAEVDEGADPDDVLAEIKAGQTLGPVAILGRTYQRMTAEEVDLQRDMMQALRVHPAWPWLEKVKGISATLGCKLLARLDVTKADTPSAFWAYCGLATVPAEEYLCTECGLMRSWPVGYKVTGEHKRNGKGKQCSGLLKGFRGPEDGARCAQPRPARGEKASYDQYAKKVCFLIGRSFIMSGRGAPYEARYRTERAKLERERPGWADGRKHMTAMRKVEKLFLSHLWLVWREAAGLPVCEPYAASELGHDGIVGPWEMV